ncbi:1-(5-phosphoribosyl)-5-[(5-phosphoribosylamino)methylideneamino]imidazole-4-carboxamide isomerase [Lysobacter capsici]|jgi:phosphoribosylformimino-5-aminoimidazole carboxamide ribotide isomerase|uniref:1-(5-phosphoribosyl)-5-[(5- phosphoribosylamino)methylideneamino]imidazole-4- carboxamide isomerase n=1 Tax=Lysobacter capsici TaxID=435897 RepID=UPI0006278957|nr:1-(5-phosphoribosyl)-5-[(5-phosphoribosylamino)methylideneamino]imidazole-4-carboxamide isomerase [Lysobacter capsici]ATE72492.1 1-(5-phosphoribosyl)-5-[(5-phosphoribosylamino)methylideneamino]imidazole-4-carboxamide isomerase [Lysobacter capsici]QWF15206.1 1-(5-phosphoribosyl)-5-[(5-phosphoribosylamino)methylideneamino]imidazole-4-carboxamide isomerase [Lysobacter capsici]UOF13054.1 1-(5-phosphoribosyl)-5-[(5-phosphoribosylamino)methylideneamino]imidazole-4-carboxamide isomerase [Lysobacter 
MGNSTLYPAIDVRDGRVVRLHQGDYTQETRYETEPLALATRYAEAGAKWLHLIDLDAARYGGYTLAPLLRAITTSSWMRVQTGGGVRSEADVEAILDAGADRVVVGSLAVKDPDLVIGWLKRFGSERITIALDVRQTADGAWELPVAGWTEDSGVRLETLLERYAQAGLRHLLCTDVSRDGTMTGPNLDLYRHIHSIAPDVQLQASGGIRDIADIVAADGVGCSGAVLGKALIEGRFQLTDALKQVRRC